MGIFNLTAMANQEPVEVQEKVEVTNAVSEKDEPVTLSVLGQTKTEENGEKLITLDGPLSRIYTKALNLAYAKESMTMMNPGALQIIAHRTSEALDDTYVYCIDTTMMDAAQLVASAEQLREAMDSGKYKNCVLAVESDGNVSSKMQLLAEMGEALGAKVCYSRESAIAAMLGGLK